VLCLSLSAASGGKGLHRFNVTLLSVIIPISLRSFCISSFLLLFRGRNLVKASPSISYHFCTELIFILEQTNYRACMLPSHGSSIWPAWTEIEQSLPNDCFLRSSAHHTFRFVCETARRSRCRSRPMLAFASWCCRKALSILTSPNVDPRTGLKQMMKRLTPIMFLFAVVVSP